MASEDIDGIPIAISTITEPDVDKRPDMSSPHVTVGSIVHPGSGMSMASSQSETFLAPPDDLLTHFDVVNQHVARATQSLHFKMEELSIDQAMALRKEHLEVISMLNEKFGEVYDRVRAVEQEVAALKGKTGVEQESIVSKLDDLTSLIQGSVIKRLDEELSFRSELGRRLDYFALQLQDTLMRQHDIVNVLKCNGLNLPDSALFNSAGIQSYGPTGRSLGQTGIAGSIFPNQQFLRQHMSYAAGSAPVSPGLDHESFANHQARSSGQKPKEETH